MEQLHPGGWRLLEDGSGRAPLEGNAQTGQALPLIGVVAVLVGISIAFENGKDMLFRAARRGTGTSLVNTLFGGAAQRRAEVGALRPRTCAPLAAELTLLGFIGLLVYSVQRAELLSDLSAVIYGEDQEDKLPELTGACALVRPPGQGGAALARRVAAQRTCTWPSSSS